MSEMFMDDFSRYVHYIFIEKKLNKILYFIILQSV